MIASTGNSYLKLSENPVRFEAVNQVTNVFFDDSNKQVFAVRSGGVMGVVVKGANEQSKAINFRMEDHGPVISIKFSLDQKVLAVQRTTTSVEFMNFNGTIVEAEYSQACKKNSTISGFVWSQNNEVAFMTDHGVELYLVIPEKQSLKHLKTLSVNIQWFLWCSTNKVALVASAHGSILQPILFKPASISKLQKVETEAGRMASERDVTFSILYGALAVLIVRHQSGGQQSEVHIHTLSGPGQAPVKSYVLKLGLTGRFAVNIVDSLILIHHQASRCSLLFDIALPIENDGYVTYHTPIAPARSLKPAILSEPGIGEPHKHNCELYSPNWVVFQPNIVIDAKLGCLWHIELCLKDLSQQISDLGVCTQVLLKREGCKDVIIEILMEHINRTPLELKKIHESFNHINNVYRLWAECELNSQTAAPANAPMHAKQLKKPPVLIDQDDVYNNILQQLDRQEQFDKLEWILIAYMTSLSEFTISPQHNINEMFLTTLIRRKKFTALQQLLQYGVVTDSKPLACLLISLGNVHPAAYQLALDMFTRLGANEEIQEVLISQGQLLSALKLGSDSVSPRKFLDAALKSGDDALFHCTFQYFKTNPHFVKAWEDERLSEYSKKYEGMFKME